MRKKNESGAILVEVIAVLGILAILGPIIYRQIISRNYEISNINAASEIKTLKEAFSTFIQDNRATLVDGCTSTGSTPTLCSYLSNTQKQLKSSDIQQELASYLPASYTAAQNYDYYLYGKNLYNIQNEKTGVSFYGIILPKKQLKGPWNLKRAARIATLIGTDGGIVQGNDFIGTLGGWRIDNGVQSLDATPFKNSYLAFTGFDTNVAPNNIHNSEVIKDLHAWNYFSVGEGKTDCFSQNAQGNVILQTSENCSPLFWVGAAMNETNSSEDSGNVYIKNDLHIGRKEVSVKNPENEEETIKAFVSTAVISDSQENDTDRSFTVYDLTGTKRVMINAQGRFIAYSSDGQKEVATLEATKNDFGEEQGQVSVQAYTAQGEIKEGIILTPEGLASTKEFEDLQKNNETDVYNTYKVDPAYTSVLNDVKLASRGGARLSEILPDYILKNVVEITQVSGNVVTATVPVPTCPQGYTAAVTVTPVHITGSDDLTYLTGTGNSLTTTYKRGTVVVSVDNSYNSIKQNDTSDQSSAWTINVGYANVTSIGITPKSVSIEAGSLKAIAHTYCVFNKESFKSLPESSRK